MKNNQSTSSGAGFGSLLQIAFIVLKLCKVINWSWWLVMIPTIAGAGFLIIALLLYAIASKWD
jgi:ABC-type Fe3+-siderophore transport system permease subunit